MEQGDGAEWTDFKSHAPKLHMGALINIQLIRRTKDFTLRYALLQENFNLVSTLWNPPFVALWVNRAPIRMRRAALFHTEWNCLNPAPLLWNCPTHTHTLTERAHCPECDKSLALRLRAPGVRLLWPLEACGDPPAEVSGVTHPLCPSRPSMGGRQ